MPSYINRYIRRKDAKRALCVFLDDVIPTTKSEAIDEAISADEWGYTYIDTLTDNGAIDLASDIEAAQEAYNTASREQRAHERLYARGL